MSQQQVYRPQIKNKFHYSLHKLFDHPAVILIGGIWKSGKTDFALFIAETLQKLNIIREVASNIDTKDHFPMITDLLSLRQWLYGSNKNKLYIFDEANIHLTSRRAMSGKNTEVLRLFGEVSKAHARMIFIAQNLLRVDKELLDETWVRGVFIKRNLKKADLISHLIRKKFSFKNIPRTSIPFDPYAVAPFTQQPQGNLYFKDTDLQILWDWSNGATYKTLGLAPMTLHRKLKKFVKQTLENSLTVNIHSR